MSQTNTINSSGGSNDGFFSRIGAGIASGVGETAKLLPIWAADQLRLQSTDQLNRDTYVGDPNKNISNYPNTMNPNVQTQGGMNTQESLTSNPNMSFTDKYAQPILIGSVALLVGALIIKAMR